MGVTDKIKDKLTGGSSASTSNKLEKPYDSSSSNTSHLQHPISSASPTGTAVADDKYATQSSNYSSQPNTYSSGTTQSSTYSSGTTQPSGYSTSTTQPSGYSNTTTQPSTYSSGTTQPCSYSTSSPTDRVPGSYVSDNEHSGTTNSSSTAPRQPYECATGPRQPYDPYSQKGQQTAAAGPMPGSGTSQTQNYSRPTGEDPSISRSKYGGVSNQMDQQRYTSDGTTTSDPYQSQSTTSQHHYGRDAAIVDGVGAGGVGAYELGQHQQTESRTVPQYQTSAYPQTGQQQDVSYMNRSTGGAQYEPETRRSVEDPSLASGAGVPSESAGLAQAKKMGGAYESGYRDGYRDAMEHVNAQR